MPSRYYDSISAILKNDVDRLKFDSNFSTYAPISFLYERNTNRSEEISAKLRKEYLNEAFFDDQSSLAGLSHVFVVEEMNFRNFYDWKIVFSFSLTELLALAFTGLWNWLQHLHESIIIVTVMLVDSVTYIIQMISRMVSKDIKFSDIEVFSLLIWVFLILKVIIKVKIQHTSSLYKFKHIQSMFVYNCDKINSWRIHLGIW